MAVGALEHFLTSKILPRPPKVLERSLSEAAEGLMFWSVGLCYAPLYEYNCKQPGVQGIFRLPD